MVLCCLEERLAELETYASKCAVTTTTTTTLLDQRLASTPIREPNQALRAVLNKGHNQESQRQCSTAQVVPG
jgi:hypothetical protein